jgi:hypothetical protein
VATEHDLYELVAQSLMSKLVRQLLPWNSILYPWRQSRRLLAHITRHLINKPQDEHYPHTSEEIFLEQVRLYTGLGFRIERFSLEEALQKFEFQGGLCPKAGGSTSSIRLVSAVT